MRQEAASLVSVIIPTFNRAAMVEAAVESVLAQAYRPLEVLVVDDGSTDDTRRRLARFGDEIRTLTQPNRGCAAARNRGAAESRGEYVAFLDSDDRFLPDKLERQVAALQRHPEADFCYGPFQVYYDHRPQLRVLSAPPAGADFERLRAEYFLNPTLSCTALMIRRRVFDELGGFDESLRLNEDGEFTQRLVIERTGVWSGDEPLTLCHQASHNKTLDRVAHARAVLRNARRIMERYPAYRQQLGERVGDYLAHRYFVLGKALLEEGRAGGARDCFDAARRHSPRESRRLAFRALAAIAALGPGGRPVAAGLFGLMRLRWALRKRLGWLPDRETTGS